ncbi:MAG: hypothetical protein IAE78_15025 [Myxococcus sp.]|nr:hypothetical protein [Myxococcus sp.]
MRQLVFSIGLCLIGCQCLQPVEEQLDAGPADGGVDDAGAFDAGAPDAGRVDGGGTFDAGVECVSASGCTPRLRALPFCSGGPVASCVNSRCLVECAGVGGRTCSHPSERCLVCDGGMQCSSCAAPACAFTVRAIEGACAAPFLPGATLSVRPFSGRCGGGVVFDGGLEGVWLGRFDQASSIIELPALGGTCLGTDLATGVQRTLVSCPACTFIAEGCE